MAYRQHPLAQITVPGHHTSLDGPNKKGSATGALKVIRVNDNAKPRITEPGPQRQISRKGSGLIALYRTVFVMLAWPRSHQLCGAMRRHPRGQNCWLGVDCLFVCYLIRAPQSRPAHFGKEGQQILWKIDASYQSIVGGSCSGFLLAFAIGFMSFVHLVSPLDGTDGWME
jgi:hypothetical protein